MLSDFFSRIKRKAGYVIKRYGIYFIHLSKSLLKNGKDYWCVMSHEIIHIILDKKSENTGKKYKNHGIEFQKIMKEMNDRYQELIGQPVKLKFKVDKRRQEWRWQPICNTCNLLLGKPRIIKNKVYFNTCKN